MISDASSTPAFVDGGDVVLTIRIDDALDEVRRVAVQRYWAGARLNKRQVAFSEAAADVARANGMAQHELLALVKDHSTASVADLPCRNCGQGEVLLITRTQVATFVREELTGKLPAQMCGACEVREREAEDERQAADSALARKQAEAAMDFLQGGISELAPALDGAVRDLSAGGLLVAVLAVRGRVNRVPLRSLEVDSAARSLVELVRAGVLEVIDVSGAFEWLDDDPLRFNAWRPAAITFAASEAASPVIEAELLRRLDDLRADRIVRRMARLALLEEMADIFDHHLNEARLPSLTPVQRATLLADFTAAPDFTLAQSVFVGWACRKDAADAKQKNVRMSTANASAHALNQAKQKLVRGAGRAPNTFNLPHGYDVNLMTWFLVQEVLGLNLMQTSPADLTDPEPAEVPPAPEPSGMEVLRSIVDDDETAPGVRRVLRSALTLRDRLIDQGQTPSQVAMVVIHGIPYLSGVEAQETLSTVEELLRGHLPGADDA